MGLRLRRVVGVGEKAVDDRGRAVVGINVKEALEGVGTPGYPPRGLKQRIDAGVHLQASQINLGNIGTAIAGLIVVAMVSAGIRRLVPGIGSGGGYTFFFLGIAAFTGVRVWMGRKV